MKINIRLYVMMVSASPKLCRKDLQQQKESQPRRPRVDGGSKRLQIRRLSRTTEKCPTDRLHTDRRPNVISCLNRYSSEWFVWFLSHFAFNTKRCCTFICVTSVRRTKRMKAPPTQSRSEGNLQTALFDVWIQLEAFKSLQKQRAKFSVCH